MKTLAKPDFERLLEGLIASDLGSIVGSQRRDEQFGELESPAQLDFEYDLTIRETGRVTRLVQCNGARVQ